MPETDVNGVRLYYEVHGDGDPIACIHGTGSSALAWGEATEELTRIGKVVVYDRRGCTRSERPDPYDRTTVAEQADDAASLLAELDAAPAVVVGRSYGGAVATDLALRHPERVRALALLEPADLALTRAESEWLSGIAARMREVADSDGVGAVGEELLLQVLGKEARDSLPDAFRKMFADNSPSILVEMEGEPLQADTAALSNIDVPVLLVAAADSPPMFREIVDVMESSLPDARTALIGGGHLINPACPEVIEFIEEVFDRG